MKTDQALREFLLGKEAEGRSRRTLVKYRQNIKTFLASIDSDDLEDVTAHDVRTFLAARRSQGMLPSSCRTYYRSLNTFFRWTAREYGVPTPNPVDRVDPPQIPRRIPPSLSDDGFVALLEASDQSQYPERDRAILLLLLDTGIRAGELVGLNLSDLDLAAREIKAFGKDQEERIVPFEEGAAEAVGVYLAQRTHGQPDDPLFHNTRDPHSRLSATALLRILKRLARRAKLDENVYPHLIRHTFAKKWLRGPGKGDIEALREIMGHSSVETTRIYACYEREDIRRMHKDRSPANQILAQAKARKG